MYHLKLVKGRTYWGIVKASAKEPDVYVEEKEKADSLVASGFFVLAGQEEAGSGKKDVQISEEGTPDDYFAEPEEEEPSLLVELQGKTKDELVTYAKSKGIDLTGCGKKDEILQRILQELARADQVRESLRK